MTRRRTIWIVLLIGVVAVVTWAVDQYAAAKDRPRPLLPKFEYAQLYVGEHEWIFHEAQRRLKISPPAGRLSGGTVGGGWSGTEYLLAAKEVRNHDVAVMDIFGAQGWEAVAVIPKDPGYVVLMKRSVPL